MASTFRPRLFALLLTAAILPACGSSSGGMPAVTPLKAVLRGGQEAPAVTTAATGTAQVTVDPARTQAVATVTVAGLAGITMAHIHVGPVGADGPVIFDLATASFTSPLTVTLMDADLHAAPAQGITTFAEALDAMAQGKTYVNVHTGTNPDGEIRGQLGPITFGATLSGASEVPPVATAGSGTVTLHLDGSQSRLQFTVVPVNLSSTVTMSHIHVGEAGVNGPIILNFATAPYLGQISGTLTASDLMPAPAQGINTFEDAVNALLTGRAYANVHTSMFASGEVRGQISVVP